MKPNEPTSLAKQLNASAVILHMPSMLRSLNARHNFPVAASHISHLSDDSEFALRRTRREAAVDCDFIYRPNGEKK
jgi:hypothetical protein